MVPISATVGKEGGKEGGAELTWKKLLSPYLRKPAKAQELTGGA